MLMLLFCCSFKKEYVNHDCTFKIMSRKMVEATVVSNRGVG